MNNPLAKTLRPVLPPGQARWDCAPTAEGSGPEPSRNRAKRPTRRHDNEIRHALHPRVRRRNRAACGKQRRTSSPTPSPPNWSRPTAWSRGRRTACFNEYNEPIKLHVGDMNLGINKIGHAQISEVTKIPKAYYDKMLGGNRLAGREHQYVVHQERHPATIPHAG